MIVAGAGPVGVVLALVLGQYRVQDAHDPADTREYARHPAQLPNEGAESVYPHYGLRPHRRGLLA